MKHVRTKTHRQDGFTILELMIAMTVFTLMLMICLATFLQVGRLFTKGVNMTLVQQDARNVTSDIASDIQFSDQSPPPVATSKKDKTISYFCVGQHEYAYRLAQHKLDDTYYGLKRFTFAGSCGDPVGITASQTQQMMGNDMQLNQLTVDCNAGLCQVSINLLFYGVDNTVFYSAGPPVRTGAQAASQPDAQCTGSLSGSQYCATATFSATVLESF